MPVPLHNIHMAAIYLSIVGRSGKGSIFVQICHLFLHELKKVKIGFFFCPLKKPKRKQSSVPRARTLACRAVRVRHAQPAAGTTSHCRRGPATPVDPLLLQFQPYSEALLTCRGPSQCERMRF
jgi:hypothetical protein